ncbi:MAG: hypothetical protein V1775_08315 [Bacteroidota bacterium]
MKLTLKTLKRLSFNFLILTLFSLGYYTSSLVCQCANNKIFPGLTIVLAGISIFWSIQAEKKKKQESD